jgi:peptidoglycan hydrolase-like protein with peptidoglycan-binding domain
MVRPLLAALALVVCLLAAVPPAHAASANTAALQVALRGLHLYGGSVDGVTGPATRRAIRRLQRRRGLPVDGIAGRRTLRALGRRGRPVLGSRVIRRGRRGWDVAALQFLLRKHGCRPGGVDGGFGRGTAAALRRCQRAFGLRADGIAGPATIRTLRTGRRRRAVRLVRVRSSSPTGPVRFLRPVAAPITDGFGRRWGRPHQGLDFPAPAGTPVTAAGRGVVRSAGWSSGGYGNLVVVTHRLGFETWYAHLRSVAVRAGQPVDGTTVIGAVGSTGHSTGPHLHFESRLNGTPVDPMPRLLG